MDSTEIVVIEKVNLENGVLVSGLPGIGNVGKASVTYLIDFLKAKKFADLYSNHFLHITLVNENAEVEPMKNEFYYYKARRKGERDIIFLTGHTQSASSEGQYEVAKKIVQFSREIGAREIITLAGLGVGEIVENPQIFGILSHKELRGKYEKYGIHFEPKIGQVFGAAGIILSEGAKLGMKGICLLGETPGFLVSDPKATEALLKIMEKILKVKLNYSDLDKKIKETEKLIKRIQELQTQMMTPPQKQGEKKELSYIG